MVKESQNDIPDVFISYAEENSSVAVEIAHELENVGFSVWFYERDIIPGYDHTRQTSEVISKSKAVILLISEASLCSHYVSVEAIRASETKKLLIPVLVDITFEDVKKSESVIPEVLGMASGISISGKQTGSIVSQIMKSFEVSGIYPATSIAYKPKRHKRKSEVHQGRILTSNRWVYYVPTLIILAFLVLAMISVYQLYYRDNNLPQDITAIEVVELLDKWSSSQENHDIILYESCYSHNFTGKKLGKTGNLYEYDYDGWIKDRTEMIQRTDWLKIEYNDLVLENQEGPDKVIIQFKQIYRSDRYSDQGQKRMMLQKYPEGLKIIYEEMLSTEYI